MNRACPIIAVLLIGASLICFTYAQTPPPAAKNQLVWTQQFLKMMYPKLNNGKYTMSVETSIPYDQPADSLSWMVLYVGEGFKHAVLRVQGGCSGSVVSSIPPPHESEKNTKKVNVEDCRPGPVYPRQFLTAGFRFDQSGHLSSFTADGPAIQENDANKNLAYDAEMTDADIIAAIKRSGAKYGPDDKGELIRNLPLKELEHFLGKLELISVHFHPLRPDRANLPNWPDWTVKLRAARFDGTTAEYKMTVDHVTGDLTGLCTDPQCHDFESLEKLRSTDQ
jgi:hypothetical protein